MRRSLRFPLRSGGWLAIAAAAFACGTGEDAIASHESNGSDASSPPFDAGSPRSGRYIYAALLGGAIGVYDIDHGHRRVRIIGNLPLEGNALDVRAMTGNARTHALYLSYMSSTGGHIVCVDLLNDAVLWHRDVGPGVDRGDVVPDGTKLYVPTNENNSSDYDLVLEPADGGEMGRVTVTPKTHDTDVGLSGKYAYLETKSSSSLAVVDTRTDEILHEIGPFTGILGPHAVNGSDSLVVTNAFGFFGFEVGDVSTGEVVALAKVTSIPDPGGSGLRQHGVAWKPDETEVWVAGGPYMHVFDMTSMPPRWTRDVSLVGYADTHWVTFSIDGAYAYPSAGKNSGTPVQVIDTATYAPVATIDYSEDLFEVDFTNGSVVGVGDEYGIGRKP
jgi:hypothetical protein